MHHPEPRRRDLGFGEFCFLNRFSNLKTHFKKKKTHFFENTTIYSSRFVLEMGIIRNIFGNFFVLVGFCRDEHRNQQHFGEERVCLAYGSHHQGCHWMICLWCEE